MKEMSKQRKWQLDHLKRGLCLKCSKKAKKDRQLCEDHLESDRKRKGVCKVCHASRLSDTSGSGITYDEYWKSWKRHRRAHRP